MIRVAGCMLVVAVLCQNASAALLASFNFNGPSGTYAQTAGVGTATFVGGSLSTGGGGKSAPDFYVMSTLPSLTWTLNIANNTSAEMTITQITFDSFRNATGKFSVSVDGQSPIDAVFTLNSWNTTNSLSSANLDFSPVVVAVGGSKSIVFTATTAAVGIDNIEVSGVVPEPASLAIFGAMGLGLAVRQYRRRK
jgi:hypothetical protein